VVDEKTDAARLLMTEALTRFSGLTSRTGADVSIATRLYPLAAALAMGCTTAMQVGQAAGPTSAAITAPDLRTRLYIFADDSMMGRQFGTEGNLKATQYIANELARLGIQPGGTGGSYFQDVPAFRIAAVPGTLVFLDGSPLAYGTDYITSFPGSGRGIPVDSVQVVYGGDLSDTASLISADQAEGKGVLLTIRTPLLRNPGPILNRYSRARTILTANDPRTMRPYAVTMSTDTTPARVSLTVSRAVAARLIGGDPAAVRTGTPGRWLRFSSLAFTRSPAPARNVIGIISGTEPALRGEYVAIGAHNDHLGFRFAGPLDHDSLRAYNIMANRIVEARTHMTPGTPGGGLTPAERLLLPAVERDRHELSIRTISGRILCAIKGYGDAEVGEVYGRALELCDKVGDFDQRFWAYDGLHSFYTVRGVLAPAAELGQRLLERAEASGDPVLLLEAQYKVAANHFFSGRFGLAEPLMERAVELGPIERQRQIAGPDKTAAYSRVISAARRISATSTPSRPIERSAPISRSTSRCGSPPSSTVCCATAARSWSPGSPACCSRRSRCS